MDRKPLDYKLLYYENAKFKEYVDRLMNPKKRYSGRSLDDVLKLKIVREVGDYYSQNNDSPNSPFSPVSPIDICDCDDKSC